MLPFQLIQICQNMGCSLSMYESLYAIGDIVKFYLVHRQIHWKCSAQCFMCVLRLLVMVTDIMKHPVGSMHMYYYDYEQIVGHIIWSWKCKLAAHDPYKCRHVWHHFFEAHSKVSSYVSFFQMLIILYRYKNRETFCLKLLQRDDSV